MEKLRFSLASAVLWTGALPIWIFLTITLPGSSGWGGASFRFVVAPVVLIGMTCAIHVLFRGRANAWAWSGLLAGIISLGSLTVAMWISQHS
jgi:hypothetical protein